MSLTANFNLGRYRIGFVLQKSISRAPLHFARYRSDAGSYTPIAYKSTLYCHSARKIRKSRGSVERDARRRRVEAGAPAPGAPWSPGAGPGRAVAAGEALALEAGSEFRRALLEAEIGAGCFIRAAQIFRRDAGGEADEHHRGQREPYRHAILRRARHTFEYRTPPPPANPKRRLRV